MMMNKQIDKKRRENEESIVDSAIETGQLMDLWQLSAEARRKVLFTDKSDSAPTDKNIYQPEDKSENQNGERW